MKEKNPKVLLNRDTGALKGPRIWALLNFLKGKVMATSTLDERPKLLPAY